MFALVLVSCGSRLDFVTTETTNITVTLIAKLILTETLTLTPSATPSPTATPTTAPTPTETLLPFAGFRDLFRSFRTWYLEDKTYFYFLNAGIEDKLFATADEFELECQADPKFPVQMICVYDGVIEGRTIMDFRFFTDRARTVQVFEARYDADLVDDTIYHHQYDCPGGAGLIKKPPSISGGRFVLTSGLLLTLQHRYELVAMDDNAAVAALVVLKLLFHLIDVILYSFVS